MIRVQVRLTEANLAELDRAIADGRFRSRAEALRRGLAIALREVREQEIDEAYRRGYGAHPEETWIGTAGLAALEAFDDCERGEPL